MMFWIVWNPVGKTPPKVKFYDEDQARHAAETLARNNPGESFHVMALYGTAKKVDVSWELSPGPMPF